MLQVVFRNAKPAYQEFGTYRYQEYDTYDNLTWGKYYSGVNGSDVNDVVYASYNQYTEFKHDSSGTIDKPLYQANSAGYGVWWN